VEDTFVATFDESNETADSVTHDSSIKHDEQQLSFSCPKISCPKICSSDADKKEDEKEDEKEEFSLSEHLSPETLEAIEQAKSELSAASIDRFMQAASYVPPAAYTKVVKIMNAIAANPNLDGALEKLARMAERTGLPAQLQKLGACIDQIPDDIFDHAIEAIATFDEEQFNKFCDTVETLDPKAISAFSEGLIMQPTLPLSMSRLRTRSIMLLRHL
jgi:hypothetical protein